MTGLPCSPTEHSERAERSLQNQVSRTVGLLLVDLSRFRHINESLGRLLETNSWLPSQNAYATLSLEQIQLPESEVMILLSYGT